MAYVHKPVLSQPVIEWVEAGMTSEGKQRVLVVDDLPSEYHEALRRLNPGISFPEAVYWCIPAVLARKGDSPLMGFEEDTDYIAIQGAGGLSDRRRILADLAEPIEVVRAHAAAYFARYTGNEGGEIPEGRVAILAVDDCLTFGLHWEVIIY